MLTMTVAFPRSHWNFSAPLNGDLADIKMREVVTGKEVTYGSFTLFPFRIWRPGI